MILHHCNQSACRKYITFSIRIYFLFFDKKAKKEKKDKAGKKIKLVIED